MRLALLGTQKGPWVSIKGMPRPVVKVIGLEPDSALRVRVGEAVFWIDSNGKHLLTVGEWAICEVVRGNPKRVVCHIVSSRAA